MTDGSGSAFAISEAGMITVSDSRGRSLTFTVEEWHAFAAAVEDGEFDQLTPPQV